MLSLCRTLLLFYFLSILVECSHPVSLTVRKLNRQLIARKRQNTLDLCQMFNVENEKAQSEMTHNRVRRAAPSPNSLDRVERLVDQLYDEPEDGGKVAYRKPNLTTSASKNQTSKSGRRFDFAPSLLEVNIKKEKKEEEILEGKTIPVPWHKYWKHGIIPYFIDSNTYDTFLAEKIMKAFDNFEQNTCIRLQRLRERPVDQESLQRAQWLYITNPSGTRQCVHSNEMKTNSGVQMVVFGYDCMSEGQIMHEVMHILGFSHEHVREDRDKYVNVMWDHIKPGYKKFFEIKQRPSILSSLPYDYASVLHYPPRAFSKNGKYTLVAESGVDFGQREGLSEIDVEKVSMIYGGECIDRNKHYLVTTCPTVIASKVQQKAQKATQQEIEDYFRDKLWPYGIVNYKLKDKIEFSIEERQNIEEVIKHIEKETCIEFRDFSKDDDDEETNAVNDNVILADDGNQIPVNDNVILADDGNQIPVNNEVKALNQETSKSSKEIKGENSAENDSISDKSPENDSVSDKTSAENSTISDSAEKSTSNNDDHPGDWANMTQISDANADNGNLGIWDNMTILSNANADNGNLGNWDNMTKLSNANADNGNLGFWANMTKRSNANADNAKLGIWANMTKRSNGNANNVMTQINKKSRSQQKVKSASRRFPRSVPPSPARRHADDLLVLSRSSESGCRCPNPGRASAQKELVITADCFNSVNDLLHLFVHVLGLGHQHNSHDRDNFIAIDWGNVSSVLKEELQDKLPPAASVGFAYDYQSVMHYPWLDIKQGTTNIMYPVWNDGWAMGHWQGLSSIDVQKLNLLYFSQCQSRKKHMAELLGNKNKL